ncbi:MAG: hypothetical protein OEQ13_15295, partial [Acidobacteriota bacterium]|nr:hypothetical protein [Acidobacteriota bacterium]
MYQADLAALAVRTLLDRLAAPLARVAAAAIEARAWFEFGYARQCDYSRERLQRSSRWLRKMAVLGRALARLPELECALSGDRQHSPIGQVAACEIARVATETSVSAWVAHARNTTVRCLMRDVREALAAGSESPPGLDATVTDDGGAGAENAVATVTQDASLGHEHDEATLGVSLLVPSPVHIAFEETLELHRAVCGGNASLSSFIEALVADNQAGPSPADLDTGPPPKCDTREQRVKRADERRGRRSPRSRLSMERLLDARHCPDIDRAWRLVASAQRLEREAGDGPAEELDAQLRELLDIMGQSERVLGRLLVVLGDWRGWRLLGYADLEHYAEQRLGISASTARERAQLARKLQAYPLLRESYENGHSRAQATMAVLRALGRDLVDEDIEVEWTTLAETATVKRLHDESRLARRRSLTRLRSSDPRCSFRPLNDSAWRAS